MESTSIVLAFFLSFFSLLCGCRGAPLSPSDQAKALNFMRKFGYLEGFEGGSAAQPLLSDITGQNFQEAIKEVQRFGGLQITGELDEKTLELMSAKRCGVPDIVKASSEHFPRNEELPSEHDDEKEHQHEKHQHHSRRKRYILQNRGWKRRHLTYYLSNWSEHLTREEVLDVLAKALDNWARYGNLRFTQISHPKDADIVFGFYRGQHDDPFAFDGPGFVLAHAFSPSLGDQKEKGLDGDVHFDADEKWVVDPQPGDSGIDLLSTALHELGHTLGLSHSSDKNSVMYAYYRSGKHELEYDDILAMRELYIIRRLEDDDKEEGYIPHRPNRPPPTRRRTSTTTTSTTTRYEDTTTKKKHWHGSWHGSKPLDGCNGGFDSVAFIRGELFITKNKMLWRLTGPGEVQKGYPVEFKRMFALPENVKKIDAMYERPTDYGVVIFSGSQFWVFDGNFLSSPRPLTDYGLPWSMTKVDAATVRNGSTYIFSDSQYWTYDDEKKSLTNSSRPLSDWRYPFGSVDSVMTYKDGNTYFFKGDHYWLYNGRLSGPRAGSNSASQFWLSC